MIWRPACMQFLFRRCRILDAPIILHARRSSVLSTSRANVATVLSTPPDGEQNIITLSAFIRTIRNQKHRSFVELGDGSTVHSVQAVLEPLQAAGLGTGTAVEITGIWRHAPLGKEQSYELKAENVKVIGAADVEQAFEKFKKMTGGAQKYPIQKKYHSAEYLRGLPHLRLRTPLNALLARIRSESDFLLAQYFRDLQFIRLQPPVITSSDCEGAGEVFSISSSKSSQNALDGAEALRGKRDEFFRGTKFLTVSSQLHLEAFIHEHQKVWTLSPTFRAEKSDTPRHISEFWMLEIETQTESLQELMDLVEDMIRSLTANLGKFGFIEQLDYVNREGRVSDIKSAQFSDMINRRWQDLQKPSWPRITYQDALCKLQEAVVSGKVDFQYDPSWTTGLQLEHEKYLAATVGQGSPVFVTDYPKEIKPFYMLPSSIDAADNTSTSETVACFDLLLPDVCEVVGGSLREHRLQALTQSMRQHGLYLRSDTNAMEPNQSDVSSDARSAEKGDLDWYVDLRRFGSVPHGGFGLGFDRLLGYLCGVTNIKDVVPWPRYYGRCDC